MLPQPASGTADRLIPRFFRQLENQAHTARQGPSASGSSRRGAPLRTIQSPRSTLSGYPPGNGPASLFFRRQQRLDLTHYSAVNSHRLIPLVLHSLDH